MDRCEVCGASGDLQDGTFYAHDPVLRAQQKRTVKLCAECAGRMEIDPRGGAPE